MENTIRAIAVSFICLSMLANPSMATEPDNPTADSQNVKAAVIVCKGMIDDGLYKSIIRRTELALADGADYLIYEIGTYGGFLQSADDISKYFILEIGDKADTVAYVTSEAISAGAMISVSCEDIIMLENTTIGDCAPITPGSKLEGVEREKAESFTRAAFMRAAEANGYPAALLKAMVSMQLEVYRIRNLKTEEYEFFESDQIPKDPNLYDLDNKELIVKDDEILTLTASQAYEYGIAGAQVENLDGALAYLSGRDGVTFIGEPVILDTNWSEEMVRWLNSPAVLAVLVMLALLGVYIEFSTPGLGLPGLVAVICFAIIIGSKYFIGLANWLEVGLFVVGMLLLLVEVFILPGFGIAGITGIICIFAGLFGMLIKNPPDKLPWPQTSFDWQFFSHGIFGILVGFLGFFVLAWLLARYMPKLQFLSGLILVPANVQQGGMVAMSSAAAGEIKTKKVKTGDLGVVLSTLRPTGEAKFGDLIIDVVAEGEFLEKGAKVKIIRVQGNRVVVRRLTE